MNRFLRSLILCLAAVLFAVPASAAKTTPTPTPPPQEIATEVIDVIPEQMQQVLDIAYEEWQTIDGKRQKNPNKFTKWNGSTKGYGWCGGFITWCMIQAGIPMEQKNNISEGVVEGLFHVKEAGVGKLVTGYTRMYRTTMIPQKGFILVYGKKGKNGLWHVGLVYDVQKLEDGRYRITTIEGNVNSSVWMYTHDYDPYASSKIGNITLVPEEERTDVDAAAFSWGYTYKDKDLYVNMFLMPWVPGQEE